MTSKNDELSVALEALRDRPIVTESRDYARRWEHARKGVVRARGVVFGVAGALAGCAIAIVAFTTLPLTFQLRHAVKQELIETPFGDTRALGLEDGSRIVLDRNSRLRVAYTRSGRDIDLLAGQARFEVAKDANRPFRVHTKSADVVAVGTTFEVSTQPARTTVTLLEGRVNVRTISATELVQPRVEVLAPGQQLEIAADGALVDHQAVNVENVTAWERGTLVIDDAPLHEALDQMNRYSSTRLVVQGGPALLTRRVSGVFRVGDVETEAVVLQKYFGLEEASRSEREIVLVSAARPLPR
jgi:transmembrane sensor